MPKHLACPHGQNNLLYTMTPQDRERIEPLLRRVDLPQRFRLEEPDKTIEECCFPVSGIGSTVAIGSEGKRIEAGLFGREGMSGIAVVMDEDRSPNETFMQIAGHGFLIKADELRALMEASKSLRRHLMHFAHAQLTQTIHTALSNGHGRLEERLARWILMCHDRIDGDELALTHEFMALMLGVRRAGVTVGTHVLEGKGLIRNSRGMIIILDREGLEEQARQSYGVPEAEYARVIG